MHPPTISLSDFLSPSPHPDIFPTALTYPQFFTQNLLSSTRVIKLFPNDPHCNLRVFYYNLLKLSYQFHDQNNQTMNFPITNFKNKVFDQNFQIRFTEQSQEQQILFNNHQFKKLLNQFLQYLDKNKRCNVEQAINQYPIMDIVFVHVLRSLLCDIGVEEEFDMKIQTEIVFGQLCEMLEMGLGKYGLCWKFEDSDMFCLDECDEDLYFVYSMNDEGRTESKVTERQKEEIEERERENQYLNLVQKDIGNIDQYVNKNTVTGEFVDGDWRQIDNKQNYAYNVSVGKSMEETEKERAQNQLKNDLMKLELSAGQLFSKSNSRAGSVVDEGRSKIKVPDLFNLNEKTSFRMGDSNEFKKQSFTVDYNFNYGGGYVEQMNREREESERQREMERQRERERQKEKQMQKQREIQRQIQRERQRQMERQRDRQIPPRMTMQQNYPSFGKIVDKFNYKQEPDQIITTNNYKTYSLMPSKCSLDYPTQQPIFYQPQPTYNYTPFSKSKPAEPQQQLVYKPIQASVNKSLNIADYYSDFTNSFLLPFIKEPFQSNVRTMKNKIKAGKRDNVRGSNF